MSSAVREPLLSPELLAQLERLELVSRKIFRGRMKGERRSTRRGQSVEFADFRAYVPGDDLRFVDWNTYARLERLFIKLFLEEEDLHVDVLIDSSASMTFGEPSKFDYARKLAAALGFIGLVRGDRVRMDTLAAAGGRPAAAYRGRGQLWRMLETLERIEPGGTTQLAAGVKRFCLQSRGRGIVVLLSDLLDKAGYEPALRYLLTRQMDVYVVQILAAEELEPDVSGDLRLVDVEDDEATEITISAPVLQRYRAQLARWVNGAKEFCTRRGMHYVLADVRTPVEQLVAYVLRRHGLVR